MGKMTKHSKTMKKEPLKVVYISSPIKFNATASEFMALVQELTGQDADPPESPTFTADEDGEAAAKVVADEDNVHAGVLGKQVGQIGEVDQERYDPAVFGSFDDLFLCPEMIELMFLKT